MVFYVSVGESFTAMKGCFSCKYWKVFHERKGTVAACWDGFRQERREAFCVKIFANLWYDELRCALEGAWMARNVLDTMWADVNSAKAARRLCQSAVL